VSLEQRDAAYWLALRILCRHGRGLPLSDYYKTAARSSSASSRCADAPADAEKDESGKEVTDAGASKSQEA
jgi:hypothetical protein